MKWITAVLIVGFSTVLMQAATLRQATLTLPSTALDRTGTVPAVMRFQHAHTGQGYLKIRWTDSLGRVVVDETKPLTLTDEIECTFPLDISRAVAMKNTVEASIEMEDHTAKGIVPVDEYATVDFIAKPRSDGWKDYEIMMYQEYPSTIQPKLQELGINAGQYVGRNLTPPNYLIDNNMRWYSEQIAPDFYAEYHRYRTDRGVDWSFTHAKELNIKDPSSKEALKRHPSFWDPQWRETIHNRLIDVVKRNDAYKPYFYSLSDESGIADLGAQWDFDFSDESLVPMRTWLRNNYGTLEALNEEWGTKFTDWNSVTPMTTNEAMRQKDDNFASWGDFKEWMDISYADALRVGVEAAHKVNPKAFVGIVGAQKPGWGGYDYSRLSRIVNVMEPYDIGYSVKLAHSLNPTMPLVSTTFASGNWEKHRVWFEVLQGNRGLILWDDTARYIRPDGTKGDAGAAAAGYYNELRDGMGALIINSAGLDNGIALHYSQPSMRTEWMLERRPDGDAWMKRDASYERKNNNFLRLRESWAHAIEDQGLQFNFVSYLQVQEGELLHHGYRVLVLPHSSSLSTAEVENIRTFVQAGGTVIADAMPGTFDEHSRRLPVSPLADLFDTEGKGELVVKANGRGKAIFVRTKMMNYLQDRLMGKEQATSAVMSDLFRTCGIHPAIEVADEHGKPETGIIVHSFINGGVTLLSVQTNPQQQVNELGPPDFQSNKRFEERHTVRITLPAPMYVYDTRQKKALGKQSRFTQIIDQYEPTILALSPSPLPELQLYVPETVERATIIQMSLSVPGTLSATQVYHVDVLNPIGKRMRYYSDNVITSGGAAQINLPLAQSDVAGKWTIRVRDMLSGNVQTRELDVR